RIGRVLHQVSGQFVDRLAAAAGGLGQRVPGAQLHVTIQAAANPDVHAVVLALADAHVQRRVGRVQRQVGIAPRAAVDARVDRPADAEVLPVGVDVVDV